MSEQQPVHSAPPQTNGKAIAAMVLGILAVVVPYIGLILGIIAIVFAKGSMDAIKKTGEAGRGMAVAGLVCGIVAVGLYAILILFAIIAFASFSMV
ncbi:MAG TPA: DUF4190 domain-containing protein [Bacillales bacterium]|nr:DUF4190 domain-containing protein [Bacillales bacterium]